MRKHCDIRLDGVETLESDSRQKWDISTRLFVNDTYQTIDSAKQSEANARELVIFTNTGS